jgi:hypothetical protein
MPFVMPFVLYALGAALLGWSGLTIVRADGFGALDIASTLAGAGVLSIGLGAIAAAVARAGVRIAEALASRAGPDAPPENAEPGEPAWVEPQADPARPAIISAPRTPVPRLGALPAAPTLEEPPATLEEREPSPLAPSRSEAAMAVKRGLRPTVQVARPKRETPLTADPGPEFPSPRPLNARGSRDEKRAQEQRRPWPVEPISRITEEIVAGEPAAPETAPVVPASEPVSTPPAAAGPSAPVTPAPAPSERRPRPAPIEKKRAPVAEPVSPPEPSAPAEPAPAAKTEPAMETPAAEPSGATTPEWLLRARARREARAKAESEAAAPAPQAPTPAESETRPEAAETAPQAEAQPARVVLREGEHNGVTYRFLEGGAIEAESEHGTRHFASIEELKATVARARGESGDPDAGSGPESEPASDADALDAAISALEDAPTGETASRPG